MNIDKDTPQKALNEMREYLEKMVKKMEAANVSHEALKGITDHLYLRRAQRLDEMRKAIESAKENGIDNWISTAQKNRLRQIVGNVVDMGIGKVEYTWGEFVAMYFRYNNPKENPKVPIRGKLAGTFRSVADLTSWLLTEEVKYSGFWQLVVKDFCNNCFGVINGWYAKLWIPETSPLYMEAPDGSVMWDIPECLEEYDDETEQSTHPVERQFAFKHICFNRQEEQWVPIAPPIGDKPFHSPTVAVIWSIQEITHSFFQPESLIKIFRQDWGTDPNNPKSEPFRAIWRNIDDNITATKVTRNVFNWAAEDSDIMWCDSYYTNDTSTSTKRWASMVSRDVVTTPKTQNIDPNEVSFFTINETMDVGEDLAFSNRIRLFNIARVGYPDPRTQQYWKIIGIRQWYESFGSFCPDGDDAGHEGHNWETDIPFSAYDIDFTGWNIQNVSEMHCYIGGSSMSGAHVPSQDCYISGTNVHYNWHWFKPLISWRNGPYNFTMNSLLCSKDPTANEKYTIRKIGTFDIKNDNVVLRTYDSFKWRDAFCVNYGYSSGNKTMWYGANPSHQRDWWTDFPNPPYLDGAFGNYKVTFDVCVGNTSKQIFIFPYQQTSRRYYWYHCGLSVDSAKGEATCNFTINVRQNDVQIHTIKFVYYCLWKVGEPYKDPERIQIRKEIALKHPTCDMEHGPGVEWLKANGYYDKDHGYPKE